MDTSTPLDAPLYLGAHRLRRLARGAQPFAQGLAQCRRRFGRRLYFDARGVAALIDNGTLAACAPARTPASEAVQ